MEATQMICDSMLESDEEENEESNENERGRPVAKLCILKNAHISERELPLFLGDNVLGRDPNTCTLPLSAASVSKQHATICISVYKSRGCDKEAEMEALLWDLGSMNGTRKGRLKLTPNVRYALSEGDRLVLADIPCQYVISGVDSVVSSQEDTRTPVSRNPGVKARLPDDSTVSEGDTSTGSKKCVNGDTKPRVSPKKTLVSTSCLSFEQTPTQPQKTLVPESDSDSDGETVGGGERRRVALVSDSDSQKSSPTCSTFLSPTNKVVPESEDESPITLSSSTKNRPCKHVNLSTEETEVDVGRQQLKKKKSLEIADDSESEEEGAAQGGTKSKESGQHVTVKHKSKGYAGEDGLPVSTPAVSTDDGPAFNIDSDTDMEEEEEGLVSAGPLTLNTNQHVDQPPNTVQFHMDSDTDIEEDEDVQVKAPKTLPSSNETTKPSRCSLVIQPEDIGIDSNTDVDEDDDVLADAAMKAKPTSFKSARTADSASSMQLRDFHLDSGTDVDDEEEEEDKSAERHENSKTDGTLSKLDVKVIGPESAPAAPTDAETVPASTIREPTAVVAVRESCTIANAGAVLDTLSDSETDMEDNSPVGIPAAVTTCPVFPCKTSEARHSDSDADTDVDESSMPPAGNRANPAHLRVGGDKDEVEDKEADIEEAGEDRIPHLDRENTPGFLVPILQNCSTPVQLSAAVAPAVSPVGLSSSSDTQEDADFAEAETQPFVLHCHSSVDKPQASFELEASGDKEEEESSSRRESLQLRLSDSSHLQCQNQALATECTQAFVSVEGNVILEDAQSSDGLSAENDSNLEATQAYAENEDSARCSVAFKKEERHVDFALEATQAYISAPYSDSDDDTNQDEGQNTADAETQPIASTLAFAETQPMPSFVEETSSATDNSVCSVQQVPSKTQIETEEREEYKEDAHPQQRHISEAQCMAATQPICASSNEESDEDSFPGLQKRKAKPLQLEEEQTQSLTHSGADQTQAMATSEDGESDDTDWMPGPRKHKTKQLEETQSLTNSEVSTVESQSLRTCAGEQSDEESVIPCRRKRKANSLQLEDEQTQPLTSSDVSAVETQPIVTSEDKDSDDDDSVPGPPKRKVNQLHVEEEKTQQLLNSEPSAAENHPTATREDDDTDSMLGPRKRKAKHLEDKTQPLTSSEVSADDDSTPCRPKRKAKLQFEEEKTSTVETQPLKTKTGRTPRKGKETECKTETTRASVRNVRKSTAKSREGDEQAECSVPPRRQTRGENKTLQSTEEISEKSRSDDDDNNEEAVKQAKQTRGKKKVSKQKDDDEQKEMLEIERNKHAVNKSLINEQKEGKQQERDKLENEGKETERMENKCQARLESGAMEREETDNLDKEKEKQSKEKELQENKEEVDKPKAPTRGRRATRARASQHATQQEQESTNDDFPSRNTRSRSNSSNSVSSERSASSSNTQEGKGRGRGRGARTSSTSPQAAAVRTNHRRTTAAAVSTEQEVFDCSMTPVSRGRTGRLQGRGRRTEPAPDSIPAAVGQSDQDSSPKPTARGKKSRKPEGSSSSVLHENEKEKADSQQTRTTRGRQQTSASGSEHAAADETTQEEGCVSEESLLPKRNVRGRSQKATRSEAVEGSVASTVNNEDEAKDKRKGRKTELKANIEADCSSSTNVSKAKDKTEKTEAADEDGEDKTKDEIPAAIQVKRAGRAPSAQAKKNAKDLPPEVKEKESEKIKVDTVEKRPRGSPSASRKERKKNKGVEESETSVTSMNQSSNEEATEPQTPVDRVSRKRLTSPESVLVAKTPRCSSASPTPGGRPRVSSLAYKVLFTGVVDEAGERVLARLGGSMAKGVADMNCLVTDKVRRTVKFLCAVAKGVPIVTTEWLEKSGKAGSFLSPNAFVVKDPEQEKKFSFCLQESLRIASSQPLLQGYDIHVTKSVKPEPAQMKDIISSSGANFLPKMPTTNKPQTVVISCEEDRSLCRPAVSASLPVVSAEFILTGILQQKLDFQNHMLSPPAANLQPSAGGKGRGRRKT
ncbi:mediator of DNA damage checkpoint protein 1 isoform X2 [Stegastes partitus]|nr:PREDICTED: mediator of DNA damage checkpoint protein 1 isoform X2 [Stegastes partitus]